MSVFGANKLPETPEVLALQRDARAVIDAYRAFLANPAFEHNLDLAVLAKVAADEQVPARERRRAAEMLARYRLKAMEMLAELTGAREQSLDILGLKDSSQPLALTQINQKIEIVRTSDWRNASAIEAGVEVEALPAPPNDDDAAAPAHDAATADDVGHEPDG